VGLWGLERLCSRQFGGNKLRKSKHYPRPSQPIARASMKRRARKEGRGDGELKPLRDYFKLSRDAEGGDTNSVQKLASQVVLRGKAGQHMRKLHGVGTLIDLGSGVQGGRSTKTHSGGPSRRSRTKKPGASVRRKWDSLK